MTNQLRNDLETTTMAKKAAAEKKPAAKAAPAKKPAAKAKKK